MRRHFFISCAFPAILVFSIAGCSPIKPESIPLSEAEKKFINICADEYKYPVITRKMPNTFWIYLPIQERIIELAGTKGGPQQSELSNEMNSIRYLDAQVSENGFKIKYDIGQVRHYDKSFGYTTQYSEQYQAVQSNILSAIQRSFFEVEDGPEFIVLVVADIEKGLRIKSVLYVEDLKKAMSFPPALPQDEYAKRYITQLEGNTTIVSDTTGKHIQYEDMTLEKFLQLQLVHRINFKYQQSAFPPGDKAKEEILTIVKEMVDAYQMKNFGGIELVNLDNKETEIAGPAELDKYAKPEEKGRLIHIQFQP